MNSRKAMRELKMRDRDSLQDKERQEDAEEAIAWRKMDNT